MISKAPVTAVVGLVVYPGATGCPSDEETVGYYTAAQGGTALRCLISSPTAIPHQFLTDPHG